MNVARAARGGRPVGDITADLRRLGVRTGDLLMVHASLRALGPVEGGADGVLDALRDAVGPSGTLLMTLGARQPGDGPGEPGIGPGEPCDGPGKPCEPFDALRTPADADVGVLAEVFRTRPGTVVSNHPEGRMGASGAVAADLVRDVPWDDYYGPGSPLERFLDGNGRVLRLGADVDTVTLLHYAEYEVPLPAKRRVTRHPIVAGPDGPLTTTVSCLDDSDGIVDRPGPDYFGLILRDYLALGRASTGTVGSASSELIDGADLVAMAVGWMAYHLAPFAR